MRRGWQTFAKFSLMQFGLLIGLAAVSHSQILSDSQDRSTIERLDELKRRDSSDLYETDQRTKLTHYPLFVFIPGILGSKLEECDRSNDELVNCTPIWGHKGWSDWSPTDLSIKANKSYRTAVLDNFEALGRETDFYGEGLAFIHSLNISDQKTLLPFSYDWRQDNRLSALRLHEELCRLPPEQKGRPIVFVAHSMGGLILRYWLGRIYHQDKCPDHAELRLNIQHVFFLGTPHYGAPEAIEAVAEGFKLGQDGGVFGILKNLYSRATVERELNRYGMMFPSIYQLLPIYGDACMSDHRKDIKLSVPISSNSGGLFDLFSVSAWKDAGWPKTIPPGVAPADFYDKHLPKFLADARNFLCFVAKSEIPADIRTSYFSSEAHETKSTFILARIPHANAQAAHPKTIGFDKVDVTKGDGTVPFEIGINATDSSYVRPRHAPAEKHEYLLNSREFKTQVSLICRFAQAQVNEDLLSNPRFRDQLGAIYLAQKIFASIPLPGDIGLSDANEVRSRFPNVVAFNRSLMEARGLSLDAMRRLAEQPGVPDQSDARAILLALESSAVESGTRFASVYPSRPVNIILPFPPGSTLDMLARVLGDQLAQKWGRPVVIENISGGGGNLGAARFARSAPDGYTLMFSPPGPLTINPLLYTHVTYNPAEFVPVTLLATVPNALIVRNDLGIRSVPELISLAKANPGKLTYASQGVGSTAYLTARLFESRANVTMTHIPYRGAAPALNDILAGHADMMFDTIVTSSPLHLTGRARILAVASSERSKALPDVPTFAESGLPNFSSITWFGCVAPPGTPTAIVDQINKDIVEIVRRPQVSAKLTELMLEPVGSTPAQTAQFLTDEAALWSRVIKNANVRAE
jgi:tripartite-type tricarboxylate transporter receptor subunit TctC